MGQNLKEINGDAKKFKPNSLVYWQSLRFQSKMLQDIPCGLELFLFLKHEG